MLFVILTRYSFSWYRNGANHSVSQCICTILIYPSLMRYAPYFGTWIITQWLEFSVLSPGNVEKTNVLSLYQNDKHLATTIKTLWPVVKRHISICLPKAYCVFYPQLPTSSMTHPPVSTTVLFDSPKHESPIICINTKT